MRFKIDFRHIKINFAEEDRRWKSEDGRQKTDVEICGFEDLKMSEKYEGFYLF